MALKTNELKEFLDEKVKNTTTENLSKTTQFQYHIYSQKEMI